MRTQSVNSDQVPLTRQVASAQLWRARRSHGGSHARQRAIAAMRRSSSASPAITASITTQGAGLGSVLTPPVPDSPTMMSVLGAATGAAGAAGAGAGATGAGVVAARLNGAAEIVDPRPWAVGTIDETFRKYDVGPVLPAMGYSDGQLSEMEKIIDAADVDLVVIGTPIDLRRVITISKPAVRVQYDLEILPGSPQLTDILAPVLTG